MKEENTVGKRSDQGGFLGRLWDEFMGIVFIVIFIFLLITLARVMGDLGLSKPCDIKGIPIEEITDVSPCSEADYWRIP